MNSFMDFGIHLACLLLDQLHHIQCGCHPTDTMVFREIEGDMESAC